MQNLNKYAKSVRQEGGDAQVSSKKGLLVLGPVSRRFLHLSVSWYNIPLIEFKVTLEMLTPKVKKNTEI